MRFCQSFMTELYRHLGEHTDVPAGDIGVGGREIGYLFGQYKRITNRYESGVLTGKGLSYGGALVRTEATGYGAVFFAERDARRARRRPRRQRRSASPARATSRSTRSRRCSSSAARSSPCSDSGGYVVDERGIDLELLKQVKEVERGADQRLRRPRRRRARYVEGGSVWDVPCRRRHPQRQPERARRGRGAARWCATAARSSSRAPTCPPRRRRCGSCRTPASASGRARPPTPVASRPRRWRCSRTPRATAGPSSTPRPGCEEIMRGIHARCHETAEEYGRPGRPGARRQRRRLPHRRRGRPRPRAGVARRYSTPSASLSTLRRICAISSNSA